MGSRKVRAAAFVIFGVLVFSGIRLFANRCAYAGRPFTTEDAGVAGPWVAQLEIGNEDAFRNGEKEFSFTATPVLGLGERFELSADFPLSFLRPEEGKNVEGFSDINLILKSLLVPERKWSPAFLLRTQIKFANGNEAKGLGSGDEDYGFVGVATKTIGAWTFHANGGYVLAGDDQDSNLRNYFVYGLACEYALHPRLHLTAEMYGESGKHVDAGAFEHQEWNPLVGIVFNLTENIAWDVAGRIGFAGGGEPEYGVATGLTFNVDRFGTVFGIGNST